MHYLLWLISTASNLKSGNRVKKMGGVWGLGQKYQGRQGMGRIYS